MAIKDLPKAFGGIQLPLDATVASLTLADVLDLVGRLDDTPGFDTPRERFRRFLTGRLGRVDSIRTFIEQAQLSLAEQRRHALQDAVVLLGRFLGFDVVFGAYRVSAESSKGGGSWRSPGRMRVILDVRSDLTPVGDFGEIAKDLSALAVASPPDPDQRHYGLLVIVAPHANRARREAALAAAKPYGDVRVISSQSLFWLAETASAGHIGHEEVLRLVNSGAGLDSVIELMERMSSVGAA